MNNPAFLITDAGVVVVDPGSSVQTGEMVLRQIAKETDRPVRAVVNTHVHGDHWLGNQAIREAFPDVPIYAHPKMLEAVAKGAGAEWVGRMLSATEQATRGTVAVGPNIAVDDGDGVEIGGLDFRFHYYGHVHTRTDLMISVPQKGLLFLGDNAANRRILRMDDGSFKGSIAALDAVKDAVDATILIPGHGQTGGWGIVDSYRDYLARLYDGVRELFEGDVPDFEMKPEIQSRLSDFEAWPGFEEELGKHVSLAYLEVEKDAF